MKTSMCLILTAIQFVWSPAFAQTPDREPQETEFQRDSEQAIEETYEEVDGKTVRRVRTGRVRQRQGEARVGAIEADEVDQVSRRQKALSLTTLGLGPYGSSDVGEDDMMYGFSFGQHWEVTPNYEITADLLAAINDKGSFWNGGIGFSYLPITTWMSPLIGAAFGFGYADANPDKENAGGFSAQINGGLRLFRLSEVQMEFLANYTFIFKEGNPGVYGLQIRVLY